MLGRSDAPRFWTSYRDQHNETQLMNTQFGLQWGWGGEVRFGRRFCCDCVPYAIEATYWTTEAITGSQCATWPGGYVSTPLIVKYIDFNGENAEDWFDGAEEHRLTRRDEFHNLEVNLIREQLAWACDSPWDIGWSVGVRYFRFQEDLDFSSLRQGCDVERPGRRSLPGRKRHQQPGGPPVRLRRRLLPLQRRAVLHHARRSASTTTSWTARSSATPATAFKATPPITATSPPTERRTAWPS